MSNLSFTKLFSSITASSIWMESNETRLVWITMLAMGDPMGRIHASIPGLAHVARVTLADVEAALAVFLAPDPYSRSKDHDGRRIEVIDGGWRLINYKVYREKRDPEARKEQNRTAQKNYRRNSKPIVSQVSQSKPMSATVSHESAEEEVEEEVESTSTKGPTPETKEPNYDIPEGLSTLQYAFGLLENCCIPDTFKLRELVARTIDSLARLEKLEIHRAAETLERRIKAAQDAGETVSTFWFTDSKWRSNGANNGNRGAAVGRVERSLSAWDRAAIERRGVSRVESPLPADAGVLPTSGVCGRDSAGIPVRLGEVIRPVRAG